MKRLQNFYLYNYRLIGFIFLSGLITSILWYGFSVLFFIVNTRWSTPFILSPNQKNVLIYQEHILSVQHELLKNKAELVAAKEALKNKKIVLENAERIQLRVKKSMERQAQQDAHNSKIYNKLTEEKAASVAELNKLAAEIQIRESTIHKELKIGLITKEEALSQQLLLSNIRSTLIEAKARVYELKQRSLDFNDAAHTLNGSANSLAAMDKIVRKAELARQIVQLKSDVFALTVTVEHLENSISKRTRVLLLSKQSPYIIATKASTHVAFVPYKNLSHVKIGATVYSCYLDMILCYKSGHITQVYAAEEYGRHPIFKSDIKGQFIGISFKDVTDAQKNLLFLNYKPLLI
jgi:hypothetical protein